MEALIFQYILGFLEFMHKRHKFTMIIAYIFMKIYSTFYYIKKLSGLSLRANYTDQATAACQRT
jgi:hypothetical protein